MDELIALYEADSLECEAIEYAQNSGFDGMAVFCEGPVGDAELLVEARYGRDDNLDLANYQVLYADYPNGEPFIAERDLERALQIVLLIPYPGWDAGVAEARVTEALDDPDCIGDTCMVEFDGGHWSVYGRGDSGWRVRLLLDGAGR